MASNGLVATFALFLSFCFAVISQGSANQPSNGVGGNYVRLECIMLGYKQKYQIFCSIYFYVFSFHSFLFIFTTVVCLFTKGWTSYVFVFFVFVYMCFRSLESLQRTQILKKKSVQVGMINLVFCLKYSHAYSTGFITVGITNDNCCVG